MSADLAEFLGLLVAILGVAWYLGRKMARVEQGLALQGKTINGLLRLTGLMIQVLHRRAPLTEDEFSQLISNYTAMAQVPSHASPLAPEERDRLNHYLDKARKGNLFTVEEVEDYNDLVRKLQQERKNDPSVWPFVALGAFLSGLFLPPEKLAPEKKEAD